MIDITKLEEISSRLIYDENHKELIWIETFLKGELDKAEDIMEKEYIIFLYLVVKIKNNPVETNSIISYFWNYFSEIKSANKSLKLSKNLAEIYIVNVITHLQYLSKLYLDKYYWLTEEKIFILKNDLQKDLFLLRWEYFRFFRQIMYKYILWYWKSYFNLIYVSMVIWFLFAFIYFINDAYINYGSLISKFSWHEWELIWTFDYYLYLSISILSNLWADFDLWTTTFLRIIIWIEQMLWVILTWLFVYTLAKKI